MTPVLWLAAWLVQSGGYEYFLSGSAADVRPVTKPGFVLAGGGRDVDEAMRWFLERAGGGDIVILRASGADGYHPYLAALGPAHSIETIVFHSREAASNAFVLERIRQADGIFLAGGNQWNYVRYWRDSPVAREVNAALARGVPVGGTSAGLAVLGEFAFSAENGSITSPDPPAAQITIVRGLFRIPALACWITDSHFSERERMGRLKLFMSRIRADSGCPVVTGLGIDERTAVLMEPDGRMRVVGAGAAYRLRQSAARAAVETIRPSNGSEPEAR